MGSWLKDIPPVDTWDYATDDGLGNGFVGLKWNGQYGWYDCNKKNPMEGTGLDSNMCWAAACSNMIYWWLEQNEEYVRRYGYSGPSQYGNSVNSDVFELYRTHFIDTGNDVGGALSWFLPVDRLKAESRVQPILKIFLKKMSLYPQLFLFIQIVRSVMN